MTGEWLPIRYRDFYDIPRAVVVEYADKLYLFDCLFDYDIDDYADEYAVYVIPDELMNEIDRMSWTDLGHRSKRIGAVPAALVEFDATRRRAVNKRVFKLVELE